MDFNIDVLNETLHNREDYYQFLIDKKILTVNENELTIVLVKPFNKLTKIGLEVSFNLEYDKEHISIRLFYMSLNELGKKNIITYNDDDEIEIISENRIKVVNNKVYVDNKILQDDDICEYEIDSYESFTDETFFNLKDFNYFLEQYPFKLEGTNQKENLIYWLEPPVNNNFNNMTLVLKWLKPFLLSEV